MWEWGFRRGRDRGHLRSSWHRRANVGLRKHLRRSPGGFIPCKPSMAEDDDEMNEFATIFARMLKPLVRTYVLYGAPSLCKLRTIDDNLDADDHGT